jgi:hypothetical protein
MYKEYKGMLIGILCILCDRVTGHASLCSEDAMD